MSDSPKKFSPIFKVVVVIFGLIFAILAFQTMTIWKVRHLWTSVTGVVVKASAKGWWDEENRWRYYLEYQYKAGDRTYTNTQFHLRERSIKRYTYFIRGLKEGDAITVWYHPDKPELSVINTAYVRDGFALMTVFAGFLFLAGTMIFKEMRWQRQTRAMEAALPDGYTGQQPLPASTVLNDENGVLRLNTGMSVFWYCGVPFFGFSFSGLLVMMIFLDELNPGWSLLNYSAIMGGAWTISFLAGFIVKNGFKKSLEIDARQKKITEDSMTFFKSTISSYSFSDIRELKLHRDQWHVTNTLKNWILYFQTQTSQSIFICFRHRDIQPAHQPYLERLKKRIEYLISGAQHAKNR